MVHRRFLPGFGRRVRLEIAAGAVKRGKFASGRRPLARAAGDKAGAAGVTFQRRGDAPKRIG